MDSNHYINSLLFHPRKAYKSPDEKDVLIDINDNTGIGIRFDDLKNNNVNLIFFHGNGEIVHDYDDISDFYKSIGVNLICVGYRGYGHSNGTPDISNILTDALILFDTIINDIIKNKNKIIVMGRSLGSVSTCEIGLKRNKYIDAIIIESGFANEEPLLNLLGINPSELEYNSNIGFQNMEKLKEFDKNLLIMHAKNDHIIPLENGKMLFEKSNSNQKKMIEFPNSNHNNILMVDRDLYFNSINEFLDEINK